MQNYKNHARLYPLHHFILTPLTVGLVIWASFRLFNDSTSVEQNVFNLLLALSMSLAVLMSRIYSLKNQNRIIRIEMRLRYSELTGKSFKSVEKDLRLGQIIALRFADDAELEKLIEKAIAEKLSSKEIKLAIQNWNADFERV